MLDQDRSNLLACSEQAIASSEFILVKLFINLLYSVYFPHQFINILSAFKLYRA